jgi:hypothetical protein
LVLLKKNGTNKKYMICLEEMGKTEPSSSAVAAAPTNYGSIETN